MSGVENKTKYRFIELFCRDFNKVFEMYFLNNMIFNI